MKRYLINCYKKTRMVNWQILILTLSITACQPNVQKLESNKPIVESDALAENFLILSERFLFVPIYKTFFSIFLKIEDLSKSFLT